MYSQGPQSPKTPPPVQETGENLAMRVPGRRGGCLPLCVRQAGHCKGKAFATPVSRVAVGFPPQDARPSPAHTLLGLLCPGGAALHSILTTAPLGNHRRAQLGDPAQAAAAPCGALVLLGRLGSGAALVLLE